MPYDNWQFWAVSIAMLWGAFVVLRPFLPRRGGDGGGGSCPNCAMGSAAMRKPRPTKTRLTIEGQNAVR